MPNITPRIDDSTAAFLEGYFQSRNGGAEYLLGAMPALVERSLWDIRGRFTREELMLLIDIFNAAALMPGLAGQHIISTAVDAMELDRLDEKWRIKKEPLVKKLQGLPIFTLACLEIWANGFWYAKAREGAELGKKEFSGWVEKLLDKKNLIL